MRYRSLFFFTGKAIKERLQRVFLMIFAVSLSVGLLISMIILSKGMRERLSGELKAYGANALITSSEYINEEIVQRLSGMKGIDEVLPELYARACFKKVDINMIGMPLEDMKKLRVIGEAQKGYVLAGSRLAKAGDLKKDEEIVLSIPCGASEARWKISGIFEKVGPEDNALIMELKELQKLLGLENRVSIIMLRVNPEVFDITIENLKKEYSGLEIKTVRQIARSEESLLRKIELLLFIVTIVVLIASIITVGGIMAATIFERLIDIAIMKTFGATNRQIQTFFIFEAIIAGLLGSLGGLFIGTASAELIALSAFHRAVGFPLFCIPLAISAGLLLSIASAIAPIMRITAYRPSIILRGEI
ncbi:MAG: ABC transporter permease [Thermodesulfovibrionales bacterium]